MKFKTVSDKLIKDLKMRTRIGLLCGFLSIALAASIVVYTGDGSMKEYAAFLLIVIFGLFSFGLKCLSYVLGLSSKKTLIKSINNRPYVDITENGIELETIIDGHSHFKMFPWNELVKISGLKLNLGFFNKNAKSYKIGTIVTDNPRERIIPQGVTLNTTNLFKLRNAVKKVEEHNPHFDEDILYDPDRISIEMRDDIVSEIKKYWKKNQDNI